MGREIRMVPANWEHPKRNKEVYPYKDGYEPMFERNFEDRFKEWLDDFDKYRASGFSEREKEYYPNGLADWLQDEGSPPDPKTFANYKRDECTWVQMYETVSEGTPVSPAYATKEELIAYLAENGDFWDQERCKRPDWETLWGGKRGVSGWGMERAEAFVNAGWAPSFIVQNGKFQDGVSAMSNINT
jgi:hypothetical protein